MDLVETSFIFSPSGIWTFSGEIFHVCRRSGQSVFISDSNFPSHFPWPISIRLSLREISIPGCSFRIIWAVSFGLDRELLKAFCKILVFKNSLAAFAWDLPFLFKGISICPWNLPCLFQSVSPCLTKIILFLLLFFGIVGFKWATLLRHWIWTCLSFQSLKLILQIEL